MFNLEREVEVEETKAEYNLVEGVLLRGNQDEVMQWGACTPCGRLLPTVMQNSAAPYSVADVRLKLNARR